MGLTYRCSVGEVFDAVQTLVQKSNRGFLTASEFNSLAKKAQIDIFNESIAALGNKTTRHFALKNLAPIIQDSVVDGYLDSNWVGTTQPVKKSIFQLDENLPIVHILGATAMGYNENEEVYTDSEANDNVTVTNSNYGADEMSVKFLDPTKLESYFTSSLCPIDSTVAFGVHTRRVDPLIGSTTFITDENGAQATFSEEGQYIHIYSGNFVEAIKVRYITTPHENPLFSVNSVTGFYNATYSKDFCLSKYSFSALVDKITTMIGISTRDMELVQSQLGQEQTNVD
jgi:hypothetical protein